MKWGFVFFSGALLSFLIVWGLFSTTLVWTICILIPGIILSTYAMAHRFEKGTLGKFGLSLLVGTNAFLNFFIWKICFPEFWSMGLLFVLLHLGVFIPKISKNCFYQWILTMSALIMPMSWLVNAIGLLFFVLSLVGHFLTIGKWRYFKVKGLRFWGLKFMVAIRGGWLANINTYKTAFNLGNFTFVHSDSKDASGNPKWHLEHEAGHTLNLAVFGSVFHFVGFFHEVPLKGGQNALAEKLAESHVIGSKFPTISIWG